MNTLLKISFTDNGVVEINYLGRKIFVLIYRCKGLKDLDSEIEGKTGIIGGVQKAFLPKTMIKTYHQIIQGVLMDEIHGPKIRVRNRNLRLAMIIAGYTQIEEFTEKIREEYERSGREYYIVIKYGDGEPPSEHTPPTGCRWVNPLEELRDDLSLAVKNLKNILVKIT